MFNRGPAFEIFRKQIDHPEMLQALYEKGGFRLFARRRDIFLSDNGESLNDLIDDLNRIISILPQAELLVNFKFWPSPEWAEKYPGETVNTCYGETGTCVVTNETGLKVQVSSPFSMVFRDGINEVITTFFKKVESLEIRKHIRGIFLGAYNCGEWNISCPAPDHSECALRYFRNWLRSKYGSDNQKLQQAWRDDTVTFNTALPPENPSPGNYGYLMWVDARWHDYCLALGDALSDQCIAGAKTVKKYAPELKISAFWPALGLHQYRLDKVLKYMDFVGTPLEYYNRGMGGGVASQSPFYDTPRARGKYFLDEVDIRTHLAADNQAQYGRATNEAEAIEMLWRNTGVSCLRNNFTWYLDFASWGARGEVAGPDWIPGSWHTTPGLLKAHKQINAVWLKRDQYDLTQVDQVKTFAPLTNGFCNRRLFMTHDGHWQRGDEWPRCGLPVGSYALEDLLDGHVQLGELNIFYLCTDLQNDQIKKLQALLKDSGKTALWLNGAGIVSAGSGSSPTIRRMQELTGFRLEFVNLEKETVNTGILSENYDNPLTQYLTGQDHFGQLERPVISSLGEYTDQNSPGVPLQITEPYQIRVVDDIAVAMAHFENSTDCCAAIKKIDGFTSIVYNLPILPARILRALAKISGAHVYVDADDCVWATRGMLIHHSSETATKTISIPAQRDWFDLRKQEIIARDTAVIVKDCAFGETSFYSL